jgi:hypothetical protein
MVALEESRHTVPRIGGVSTCCGVGPLALLPI